MFVDICTRIVVIIANWTTQVLLSQTLCADSSIVSFSKLIGLPELDSSWEHWTFAGGDNLSSRNYWKSIQIGHERVMSFHLGSITITIHMSQFSQIHSAVFMRCLKASLTPARIPPKCYFWDNYEYVWNYSNSKNKSQPVLISCFCSRGRVRDCPGSFSDLHWISLPFTRDPFGCHMAPPYIRLGPI